MKALLTRTVATAVMMTVLAGCGGGNSSQGGGGNPGVSGRHHARIRIIVKKDGGGVCRIRTVPNSHAVFQGDEDELVWDIKWKDNCLDANELIVKWKDAAQNPSQCAQVATNTHGNKQQIKCDLKASPADGIYKYSVTVGTEVEDPDVEIITF